MIDRAALRLTLRNIMLTADGLPSAIVMAWENQKFAPPNPSALWMRETLLPGNEILRGNDSVQLDGFVQYDIFDLAGNGTETAEKLAKAIGDVFVPATGVVNGDTQLAIIRSETLSGRKDDIWYHTPIRIMWRAFSTRELTLV